jgi:peroxiredoxin
MRLAPLVVSLGLTLLAAPLCVSPSAHADAARENRRAWLGVELEKGTGGVLAKHVVRGSPAQKAGLADGDLVVSVEGEPVDAPSKVVAKVALAGPGSTLAIRLRRQGKDQDVTAKLIGFPGSDEILKMDKVGTFAPTWSKGAPQPATPALVAVAGSVPDTVAKARGKVLLIDFWETACGPCRATVPQLAKWQKTLQAQGLEVLGVTPDDVALASKAAVALGMNYAVASDTTGALRTAYGVRAVPTMFLVDKKGVIRDVFVGFDPHRHAEIEKQIKALLAEAAPKDAKP